MDGSVAVLGKDIAPGSSLSRKVASRLTSGGGFGGGRGHRDAYSVASSNWEQTGMQLWQPQFGQAQTRTESDHAQQVQAPTLPSHGTVAKRKATPPRAVDVRVRASDMLLDAIQEHIESLGAPFAEAAGALSRCRSRSRAHRSVSGAPPQSWLSRALRSELMQLAANDAAAADAAAQAPSGQLRASAGAGESESKAGGVDRRAQSDAGAGQPVMSTTRASGAPPSPTGGQEEGPPRPAWGLSPLYCRRSLLPWAGSYGVRAPLMEGTGTCEQADTARERAMIEAGDDPEVASPAGREEPLAAMVRELGLRGGKDRVQLLGGTLAGVVRAVAFLAATTPQGASEEWRPPARQGKGPGPEALRWGGSAGRPPAPRESDWTGAWWMLPPWWQGSSDDEGASHDGTSKGGSARSGASSSSPSAAEDRWLAAAASEEGTAGDRAPLGSCPVARLEELLRPPAGWSDKDHACASVPEPGVPPSVRGEDDESDEEEEEEEEEEELEMGPMGEEVTLRRVPQGAIGTTKRLRVELAAADVLMLCLEADGIFAPADVTSALLQLLHECEDQDGRDRRAVQAAVGGGDGKDRGQREGAPERLNRAAVGVTHPAVLSGAAMCVSFCLCWLRRHALRLSGSGAGEALRSCRRVLRRAGDALSRVPVGGALGASRSAGVFKRRLQRALGWSWEVWHAARRVLDQRRAVAVGPGAAVPASAGTSSSAAASSSSSPALREPQPQPQAQVASAPRASQQQAYHSWLQVPVAQLALAWAQLDHRTYAVVPVRELLLADFDGDRFRHTNDGCLRCVDRFAAQALWVAAEIVHAPSPAARAAVWMRFLSVAIVLEQLRDFAGVAAVSTGLGMRAVTRLAATNALIPEEAKSRLGELRDLVSDKDFAAAYLQALAKTPRERGAVPHLGPHNRNIIATDTQLPADMPAKPLQRGMPPPPRGLSSFKRWRELYRHVAPMAELMERPFPARGRTEPSATIGSLLDRALRPHMFFFSDDRSAARDRLDEEAAGVEEEEKAELAVARASGGREHGVLHVGEGLGAGNGQGREGSGEEGEQSAWHGEGDGYQG